MPDLPPSPPSRPYRGRLAPTPSGWLHLGHAATFRTAWQRARAAAGALVYRTEDIDPARCRPEFAAGAIEDLRWCGLDWDEGPDCGGPCAPYVQSRRLEWFHEVFEHLRRSGHVYPSPHSRARIAAERPIPSPVDGDPVFPALLRPRPAHPAGDAHPRSPAGSPIMSHYGDIFPQQSGVNWRFRVPDGREIRFTDGRLGARAYLAGRDFGDFIVWKKDGWPAYELAVVADDHAMGITEVVRGEDLLLSTARQLLLYAALGWEPPAWYHCPLVTDPATGRRLAKTHQSLALRELRARGEPPP